MPIGPKPEQCDIEKGAARVERCSAVGVLQCPLVTPRCVFGSAVGRNGMDVLWRHRSLCEHRFARHPIIAFGMIGRDETLVAPVPRNPRPWETAPELIRGESSV